MPPARCVYVSYRTRPLRCVYRAVVYDINGREAVEVEPVLKGTKSTLEQYIYCSSAGVYLKNDMMPHREEDAVDPKSRHKVGCGAVSWGGWRV
jgi:hypothetical protein